MGGTGEPAGRIGIKIFEHMFVGTKETRVCIAVGDCLLDRVVGLLGELPKSILILQSIHTFKWALGHHPLTEFAGTTAKGTAQLYCIL